MGVRNNYNPYSIHSVNTIGLGMNDMLDPSVIADQEIADCENFSVEEDTITTAPGYVLWDDSPQSHPGPYWGGFMFKKSDGYMVDIRQRKGILEYAIDGDSEWLPCNMPTAGSPASTITLTQTQPCFAALNDICIFTNGYEDVMSSTDGINWTIRGTLPKSKVVFDKFDYEATFELDDPRAEFRETFRFKDGSARRQKHTLYMPSIEEMVQIAQRNGWTYTKYVDLTPMSFSYGYLLFFKRNV
jgi:hypothetical protein